MQYLCMRLVSTRSSPLHAAIGSAISTISSFFVVSRACITAALILHESGAIWAQVLSAAMGAKVIKAGKGAKVIKGAGKGSKVIKGSKGGKGRGKQTLKKPASSGEGHVMKRPATAVDSPEERLKLAEHLQSEQDAKDLADTSGKHVGNTQGEAEGRDPLKAKRFKALYRSGKMDEGIIKAHDEAVAKQ